MNVDEDIMARYMLQLAKDRNLEKVFNGSGQVSQRAHNILYEIIRRKNNLIVKSKIGHGWSVNVDVGEEVYKDFENKIRSDEHG